MLAAHVTPVAVPTPAGELSGLLTGPSAPSLVDGTPTISAASSPERAVLPRGARGRGGRDRGGSVDEAGGARAGQQAAQFSGRGGHGHGSYARVQSEGTERLYLFHAPNRRMNA